MEHKQGIVFFITLEARAVSQVRQALCHVTVALPGLAYPKAGALTFNSYYLYLF